MKNYIFRLINSDREEILGVGSELYMVKCANTSIQLIEWLSIDISNETLNELVLLPNSELIKLLERMIDNNQLHVIKPN